MDVTRWNFALHDRYIMCYGAMDINMIQLFLSRVRIEYNKQKLTI